MKNGWYENKYGNLFHYVNNKIHNEKGPAVIWGDGSKIWHQNNERHRLDGPGHEYSNGSRVWYYQGKHIDCQSQSEFERYLKLKVLW